MSARDDLLELLLENARHTTADLARMTDMTEEEVAAAVAALEDEGVVRGYQAIVDWDETDRELVRATVELNVTLDRETSYQDIAERIARFPQVKTLRLVSGDYDFLMEVEDESMHDVSIFISEKVAPVPEVTQTVTHYVMTTYKDRGVTFGDGDDDDRLSVSP
ncbi:Lrp/AsnC family transcriptional regulator [Haloarchaeobius sp. HME9146]|uniref:Lrp/AsnC family transcriptional regulator n=1 Tax=unclassified Haloarchaeobius TaxID=2614452 RepID=UPI0021C0ABA9|nr:Lrp/AsnC family transcriptional regulator [Haloarchaeobius sp. HME9146]MCT9096331.1 Lrp/AsnC family transcriptional regulator [Haloarchaeobius sp. HME9146]